MTLAANLVALASRVVGVAANNLVALDAGAKLPEIDGSQLLNVKGAYWDLIVEDQKVTGINGGTATSATWNERALNTVVRNTIGATLSGNAVTLPPGTYEIEFDTPFADVQVAQAKLRNVTDNVDVALGTSEFSGTGSTNTSGTSCRSGETVYLAIGTTKAFKLYTYATAQPGSSIGTAAALGIGSQTATGIFSRFRARKLA